MGDDYDKLARARRYDMLARAQAALNELREVTWEAHHDHGIISNDEHWRIVGAYTTLEGWLNKLAVHPMYKKSRE